MAEFGATFQSADTNGDGMLVRAEFEDFMIKLGQNAAARGVPHQADSDYSAEEKDEIFAIFNAKSEGAGVTAADFFAVMGDVQQKIREITSQ